MRTQTGGHHLEFFKAWMDSHAGACAAMGKPFILEEVNSHVLAPMCRVAAQVQSSVLGQSPVGVRIVATSTRILTLPITVPCFCEQNVKVTGE
jgi:hypothetical protein